MISERVKTKHPNTKQVNSMRLKTRQSQIERPKVRDLLALVRRRYPQWKSFSHPDFVDKEIDPIHRAVRRTRELLSEGELQDLLDQGHLSKGAVAESRFDEFLQRLESIGEDSTLLWRKVPKSGDLGILYDPTLDKPTFCLAVFDLLYGAGDSPARLDRYLNYVRSHLLPNKWTFPTYFLFLCHPQTDMFIKPATIKWFLSFIGREALWKPTPTAAGYAAILEIAQYLKTSLRRHEPHDLIDIQSLLWTARSADMNSARRSSRSDPVDARPPAPSSAQVTASTSVVQTAEETLAQSSDRLPPHTSTPYSLPQCAADTGMDETVLAQWVEAIERKGQAILYGPPGTGKTFLAAHLAQHLSAEQQLSAKGLKAKGSGFWEVVQFHPTYAYEDFLQGIRPQAGAGGSLTYPLVPGRFLDFCRRAGERPGRCVLVIDEINRADLAQVLGELMLLLEYRDQAISLAGGGLFRIPGNVRLLGTMNTANRSITLLDQALRRRFAFLPVPPNFDVLRRFHERIGATKRSEFSVEGLTGILEKINRAIGDPHQSLGITFFLVADISRQIEGIWRFEIEPYLEDLFFDRIEEVEAFRWDKVQPVMLPSA